MDHNTMTAPAQTIDQEVRTLINRSIKFEFEPKERTLDQMKNQLGAQKMQKRALEKIKKSRKLTFGETLELTCVKLNMKSLVNSILYKEAQDRVGTSGPVSIFDL